MRLDASDFGIEALVQHYDDGHECVAAFASRTLSKTERRYCATGRELPAAMVFTQALPFIHFGFGIHSVHRPWFPNMVAILQGTRGATGTMVEDASTVQCGKWRIGVSTK